MDFSFKSKDQTRQQCADLQNVSCRRLDVLAIRHLCLRKMVETGPQPYLSEIDNACVPSCSRTALRYVLELTQFSGEAKSSSSNGKIGISNTPETNSDHTTAPVRELFDKPGAKSGPNAGRLHAD